MSGTIVNGDSAEESDTALDDTVGEWLHAREASKELMWMVARELVARREKIGISQRELASRARLAQTYVCDLEKSRGNPTWETLNVLCSALGTTLPNLLVDSVFRDAKLSPRDWKMVKKLSSLLEYFAQQSVAKSR